jgi:AcrR family transcriptional regulator
MATSTLTQASRRRGEYAKSAQRRREIIAAAVEVFSESGFRDGGLRTVAERAGLTHAGMRHHFPTKAELLEAVLQWREQDAVERARGQGSHLAGVGIVRAWIDSVAENTDRPMLVELEVTLSAEAISPDHPAHAYFNDLYRRAQTLLEGAFADAAVRGELKPGTSPEAAARMLLATTLGLQTLWLRDRSIDIRDEMEAAAQMILTVDLAIGPAEQRSATGK